MHRWVNSCLLLVFSLLIGYPGNAQEWVDKMRDPSAPLDEVQESFEAYWQDSTGPGWKQFKRWEWFMEPRSYPDGERIPAAARWEAWQRGQAKAGGDIGDWDYIGNEGIPNFGGGAGRVNCIAFHPEVETTVYAGAASGGLWRSTDDGTNWEPMTDDIPVLGISSIQIHPEDPDTMYIATGDGNGSDTYSVGILKSTDGGDNWSNPGWTLTQADNITINELRMHPDDPQILFASTNDGMYKSTDAAASWTQVASGNFKDIEFHPSDSSIIYIAEYSYGGNSSGFYRSTDGGDNFSEVFNGTPSSGSASRLEIAVSQDDPDRVYFVAGDASDQGFYGLYRSNDAGQSFNVTSTTPNILGYSPDGSGSGGQAYYDLAIEAHPQDADYVYVGGINIWRSTNGGYNLEIKTHWWGAQGISDVHADIHKLIFDPNQRLWVGNDGGVYRSPDNGTTWNDLSAGLEIAQIYRLAQSEQDPDLLLTGWQDNGTNKRNYPNNWSRVIGGDGMECIISHSDPSIMYGSLYYGDIRKSTDGGASFESVLETDGSGANGEGAWVTPYRMDPLNSDELIVGKEEVYQTTDGGNTWTPISSFSQSGNMRALALCETHPGHIYAAKWSVLKKKDGSGSSFVDRDAGLPTGQQGISYIGVHRKDPDKAWVTFSGYDAQEKVYVTDDGGRSWSNISQGLPNVPANCVVHEGGDNERIYVGTDLGVYYRDTTMNEFKAFNDGLPNVIVNELAIHEGAERIRAATYGRGLWESELRGDEPNSIEARSANAEFELYPNPSDGLLNGKLSRVTEDIELIVRDASGRRVHRSSLNADREEFQLDLSDLESGLYFLHFRMEGQERTKKVVLR